jgi:uncharacterized protein YgbK (DUF1537 family)
MAQVGRKEHQSIGTKGFRMSSRRESLCAVIADDLSGACDAAVQFANCGSTTTAFLDWSAIDDCEAQVVAASTESRRSTPEEAARRVDRLANILRRRENGLFFKKIDSTLRGNVAAEIDASMVAFGCRACVIAPAFPAMGRTVSNGWLRVERSDLPPMHLPTYFREEGLNGIAHVDLAALAAGAGRLHRTVAGWLGAGTRFIVLDSDSDSDLSTAVDACADLRPAPLWVGSAGLARALASHFAGQPDTSGRKTARPGDRSDGQRSVILFIGTDHPATEQQLNTLSLSRPVIAAAADESCRPLAERALREGCALIVRIHPGRTGVDCIRSFLAGLDGTRIQALILSGGDTASLVCQAISAVKIRLNAEIMDGIPWGWLSGGLLDGLPLATKSGGFGVADALIAVADFLSRCPRG